MSSSASNVERNTGQSPIFYYLPILNYFFEFIQIIITYLVTCISEYFEFCYHFFYNHKKLISPSTEPDAAEPNDTQWGLTQTKVVKCSYTWTIDNFELSIKDVYEKLESPTFSIESNGNIIWRLVMHLWKNDTEFSYLESNKYMGLYLQLVSSKKSSVRANYKFSILNEKLTEFNVMEWQKYRYLNLTTEYGSDKFIKKLTLENARKSSLPKDKLTIRCEVSVLEDRVNISGRDEFKKIPTCCISDDICKLFKDMKLSDVTLVAGGKEIRAHKAILAARSTVFAAMFEHDMQEQKLSRVDITDVDYDVLAEVLRYIYTDRVPNLDKMASDLLIVADKYALDSLKGLCEMVLRRNISVETATDILVLADLYSVAKLKAQCIAFINSHASQINETAGWKNLITTYPHLVAELFLALTVQRKQRS